MGNNPTQQAGNNSNAQKQFLQRIQKVSTSYSQQFGNYNIYQLQQKPYSYFLQYIQTSIPQSDLLQQKLKFYNNMPKNKNLVPIEFAEIVKRKQLCAQFDGLRAFCMYYNFTLQDAIKLKIKQKTTFTEGQIIYILRSLLSIGKFYQSELKAIYYSGIYQSKKIYLSPEGHIKIYPFNENIFSAYSDMQVRQEQSVQSSYIDSKKISIQLNQAVKPLHQSRKDLAFSKTTNKSQYGIRRSKLTTTLSKDYFLSSINSQQSLQLNSNQQLKSDRNTKGPLFHDQSLGYLYNNNTNQRSIVTNKRDLFQLGLLLMQLILLNESHEYYTSNKSNSNLASDSRSAVHSKILPNKYNIAFGNNDNTKSNGINYKQLQQYQNQAGKVPNIDLIHFSLTKLLPKKNISKVLLNLIQKMVFNQQNTKIDIDELHQTIERLQQLSSQPKYCIKFDTIKQQQAQNNELHVSKYMMKNKSTDPFMHTADLTYVFNGLESANQSKIIPKHLLQPAISKESFFTNTNKLDDLLNENNLTSSMIADGCQYSGNSSQVLSNLKKSRKLVPTKLRSISTKLPQKSPEIQELPNTQKYRLNFG